MPSMARAQQSPRPRLLPIPVARGSAVPHALCRPAAPTGQDAELLDGRILPETFPHQGFRQGWDWGGQ